MYNQILNYNRLYLLFEKNISFYFKKLNIGNYTVSKVAIKFKEFTALLPGLVVSIMDIIVTNTLRFPETITCLICLTLYVTVHNQLVHF